MEAFSIELAKIDRLLDEILLVLDSDKRILYCNPAAEQYLGVHSREILHQNYIHYCQQKGLQFPEYLSNVNNLNLDEPIQCQTFAIREDSEKVVIQWKLLHVLSDTTKEPVTILIGHNISAEQNGNTKIEDLENQLSSVIELMAGNYWLKDMNGVYKGFNQALLNLLGVKHEDVIGKTDYDLPWANTADELIENDRRVIISGLPHKTEEEIKSANGEVKIFEILKIPLKNKKGEIIGTMGNSIDITERKRMEEQAKTAKAETIQLKLENTANKAKLEIQKEFSKTVNQVVHDIRSPLASLMMVVKSCREVPEKERIALREAAIGIGDIANNLLAQYKIKEPESPIYVERRQPILLSALILQLLTEKKYQYKDLPIKFDYAFSQLGQFAFIQVEFSSFKRMLSNLINNAVDAFENKKGTVTVKLDATADRVNVTVEDNGKGMPQQIIDKIMQNIEVTEGKSHGHGIGLTQVRETLARNQGTLSIDSKIKKGTRMLLEFPSIPAPDWIAKEVRLGLEDVVVILDDDISIHRAWDMRFSSILKKNPGITVRHFENCHDAVRFIEASSEEEKQKIYLLTDYELLKQELNGLHVVNKANIARSILVTSHYADPIVLERASKLHTQILPKQLAADIPIYIDDAMDYQRYTTKNKSVKKVDLILVDDDKMFAKSLMQFIFKNNVVDYFEDPKQFIKNLPHYPKDTRIYLDHNFPSFGITGVKMAETLHERGFTRLYLLSGETFESGALPDYIKVIRKDDVDNIKDWER
jgi:PAS domain S-box-containing protein